MWVSDIFRQDFVLVCLSIDVTGALVLLFHLYCTSFPLSLSLVFLLDRFLRTGVSVHRRDRCTCTFSFLALFVCLFRFFFFGLGFCSCTSVSVHRRDRCTCTLHSPLHWHQWPSLCCFVCLAVSVSVALGCCFRISFHWRDRRTCLLLISVVHPLFCLVQFGGLWVCLSADVTGALPPLPPYPCAKIPTRGLVHPLLHSSSLFSLSLRHSLLLPTVPLYLLCLNMLKLNKQQLMDSTSSESKQP